jgi:hypothetical protein
MSQPETAIHIYHDSSMPNPPLDELFLPMILEKVIKLVLQMSIPWILHVRKRDRYLGTTTTFFRAVVFPLISDVLYS